MSSELLLDFFFSITTITLLSALFFCSLKETNARKKKSITVTHCIGKSTLQDDGPALWAEVPFFYTMCPLPSPASLLFIQRTVYLKRITVFKTNAEI